MMKPTQGESLKVALSHGFVAWLELCKIMLPIAAITTYLQAHDLLAPGATLFAPVMQWLNLPVEMGIVWFMAIFINIYAALAAFATIASSADFQLSVAQGSVLGAIILFAHGLVIEGAIVRKGGITMLQSWILRIGAALIYGKLLSLLYCTLGWFQDSATLTLQLAQKAPVSISDFLFQQTSQLSCLLLILLVLNTAMSLLRTWGILSLLQNLLQPLLKLLNIDKAASGLVVVGLTMGISYGSGLLFAEVRTGKITTQQAKRALIFLCLFHSAFEDSLLVMLFGGEFFGLVVLRFFFCFLVMFLAHAFTHQRQKMRNSMGIT